MEELLRFDPPLQLFERTAVVDTEVAGHPVPAGTKIAALLGAAAHDPQVFDRPAELDVGRRRNPHLGFGAGVHYCLGAPLARLEIAATLDALRTRLPGLTLSAEPRPAARTSSCAGCASCGSRPGRHRDHQLAAPHPGWAEQPGEPGDQHRGHPGGDGGEHVQHRVQHHAVGAGLHPGAQRPGQHHRGEHRPRPPTAATTPAAAGTGAAAGPAGRPSALCSISASTDPGTDRFSPGTSQPSTIERAERDGRTPAWSAAARVARRVQRINSSPASTATTGATQPAAATSASDAFTTPAASASSRLASSSR